MSIGKRDDDSIRSEAQPDQRICREARLRLLSIANHRRPSLFKPRNCVAQRSIVLRVERRTVDLSFLKRAYRLNQRHWSRDASNRFCLHAAEYSPLELHASST
jgi:hypothetical protein